MFSDYESLANLLKERLLWVRFIGARVKLIEIFRLHTIEKASNGKWISQKLFNLSSSAFIFGTRWCIDSAQTKASFSFKKIKKTRGSHGLFQGVQPFHHLL
jgi:hypothetical protein